MSIRVLRVIARLNVGGPAIQALTLTKELEPLGYRTVLVRGTEDEREGTMDPLAERLGVRPVHVSALRRDPGARDLDAVMEIARICRRFRPDIVHTHAAKAGTLGRLAAVAASADGRRPVLVHTFHGHSLTGYFSDPRARLYGLVERALGTATDRLVAVSDEVRRDLLELGVARPEKIEVIPLGFDLTRFLTAWGDDAAISRLRTELGLAPDSPVVTLVARLVPIKRVDRFLRIAERVAAQEPSARFVIAGDGELHEQLMASPESIRLGERLVWAGFRDDLPALCATSAVVVLTSDNEGTPVSLIEAQAAGRPVVSTCVGGVPSIVLDGRTGRTVNADDEDGFARAVLDLLADPRGADTMGAAGRRHVAERHHLERLVRDVDTLYRKLLAERR